MKEKLIPILYTAHISIDEIEPSIWRRLVVGSKTNLFELHNYIQIIFGWKNYHLYRFEKGGVEFGDPRLWQNDPIIDVRKITLEMLLKEEGNSLKYLYYLGDFWMHTIRLEKVERDENRLFRKPVCLEGDNAAPPEDVGGVDGFKEFCQAIADPDHPQFKEYRQWAGRNYNPKMFDLKKANKGLAGRRTYIFEYNLGVDVPSYTPRIR